MENWYKVLGCDSTSTYETLKRAYQRLALRYHPDKQMADDAGSQDKDLFLKVDKAWKILSDERSRREFDACWQQRCQAQQWPVQEEVVADDLEQDDGFYVYPCRCGSEYQLTQTDFDFKVDLVCCPSCSLVMRVAYGDDHSNYLTDTTSKR